jgi:ABC-type polysaccharide/polyol phosphate transport system ATPase subunit
MSSSIILQNVNVDYPLNQPKQLKDYFIKKEPAKAVRALSGVNLQINKGERVGLIGLNGAGKSTILKVMAKIYHPTEGICQTTGHVCPLFELATGFEMEQSGWANIYIRAMLLGMPRDQIKEKMHEIAAFTELGHFLNYPVRTYSSGMFIRLAFAVSTAIDPDILLLDEVIGAGDMAFTQKAQMRMNEFIEKGQIIVLSSHAPDLLKKFCSRTIWLNKGTIMMDGPTAEVWDAYTRFNEKGRV